MLPQADARANEVEQSKRPEPGFLPDPAEHMREWSHPFTANRFSTGWRSVSRVGNTMKSVNHTKDILRRSGFWLLAVLWLPAGVAATANPGFPELVPGAAGLLLLAVCGLPLALGCRKLDRLGYRRSAWLAGMTMGTITVFAAQVGGLLGPMWVAVHTAILGAAVWIVGYLMMRLN